MVRTCALAVIAIATAASLFACGGSGSSEPQSLVKSVDNLQCEPPRYTLAALDAELASAGVQVISASCAWEGKGQVAQCGAPAPYLRVIQVTGETAAAARSLGYVDASAFSTRMPIDCPAQ